MAILCCKCTAIHYSASHDIGLHVVVVATCTVVEEEGDDGRLRAVVVHDDEGDVGTWGEEVSYTWGISGGEVPLASEMEAVKKNIMIRLS